MAPSPTGEYHVGHIRTLLYNWAYARKMKGKFIIRIEDTDRKRFVPGATERILDVISDYGFDWDEGPRVGGPYAPYIQSERLQIYQKYANELIRKKAAYYCFCTPQRLAEMRKKQKERGVVSTKYDKLCLHLPQEKIIQNLNEGRSYVVRLNVTEGKVISFNDLVYGKVSVSTSEIDDQILLKSDGFPTYHFGVVVDDYLMKISHILRGNDWLPSTPKHILLYEAFGWQKPVYAHLPNLKELGSTKKLSKRYGPVSAREFLDQGYLPQALNNFLMFLGWNPGTDKEFYSLEEFIKAFSLEKIHKTDLVAFDRNKLDWMNGEYIRRMPDEELMEEIYKFYKKGYDKKIISETVPLIKTRIKKLSEYENLCLFFFKKTKVDKTLLGRNYKKHLQAALSGIEEIQDFNNLTLNQALLNCVKKNNFKTSDFFMDLRIAITGVKVTPPITESIVILGKDETLRRIKNLL